MSEFVQKVEKFISDKKEREKVEQKKIKAIKEKKAEIHAAILGVMYDLFNTSVIETNYKELTRLAKETEIYNIKIDTITFEVNRSNIESKIDSDPNRDVRKTVEQEILNQLENSDLPF